jgi:hypothetical protein
VVTAEVGAAGTRSLVTALPDRDELAARAMRRAPLVTNPDRFRIRVHSGPSWYVSLMPYREGNTMKRTPGLIALALAAALTACSSGPSPAAMSAWQSGTGGKDLVKVAQYLSAANHAVISGNTLTADGGGIFLLGLAMQAAGDPPPADGAAYKQEMADLEAYGKALIGLSTDNNVTLLSGPLDKAQAVIDQHKGDWWAQKLDDAMKV